MSSKFKDMISRVKEIRTVEPEKEIVLEKGDMRALVLAAFQVFGPVLLGMLAFFALLIYLLVTFWT